MYFNVFAIDRVTGLEKANGRIRDRAEMLLEKSNADDRLVDALRNEIQVRPIDVVNDACQARPWTGDAHEYETRETCSRARHI